MNDAMLLRTRRLTAEEILASLTDAYALDQNVNYGIPYCVGDVYAEMTVKEYCDQLEIVDFRKYLNGWFNLSLTREEVVDVAAPARRRTLREVCEFLAGRVEVPGIDPVAVLGRPCRSAGAFLTVRTMLARAGADVSGLAPSSPLGPYLRNHFMVFARDISKIAPGTFPRIEEQDRPTVSLGCWCICAVALVGLVALVVVAYRQLMNCCSALFGIVLIPLYIWSWIDGRATHQLPGLHGVHDFRDLVDRLLGRPLRHRIAPNLSTPS